MFLVGEPSAGYLSTVPHIKGTSTSCSKGSIRHLDWKGRVRNFSEERLILGKDFHCFPQSFNKYLEHRFLQNFSSTPLLTLRYY
jgi:hypothetical protein